MNPLSRTLLFCLTCSMWTLLFATEISCQTNYVDKNLQQVADKINKMLPTMVDDLTRVDSVKAVPDSIFQYYSTLTNSSKKEINISALQESKELELIKEMKTAEQFKVFYKNNVTLEYIYYDKNGEYITTIMVTPKKYKN
jgi:hypothetical protein